MIFPDAAGIVAEYNPLHNGHVFQMREAVRLTGTNALIVVLSGDFVQRGEPALLSMHTRAKAAVMCGADLVIELPSVFSCHNAGVFANSAVNLLSATGLVKKLSFGMEDTKWDIHAATSILVNEPDSFKALLKKNLNYGYSFAEARIKALDSCISGTEKILQGSNNSLALNYAAAVMKYHPEIELFPVQRTGTNHDEDRTEDIYASASLLRGLIKEGSAYKDFMPKVCADIIEDNLRRGNAYISDSRLWTALRSVLLRTSAEEIAACGEISEGAENKFKAEALSAKSYDEWLERCSSRRYPKGRIRRQAMQILIKLDRWTNRAAQRLGVPYIRPLAMNEKGQQLLKIMKKTATLPIISNCGDAKFSEYAASIMRYDLLASELRQGFLPDGNTGTAHSEKIFIKQNEQGDRHGRN